MIKSLKDLFVVVVIFLLIAFLLFGALYLFVSSFLSFLLNKWITYFVISIISCAISGLILFLLHLSIKHYDYNGERFLKFLPFFVNTIAFALILLAAINNAKYFDISLSSTLLSIEWTIFGISGAVFLYQIQVSKKELDSLLEKKINESSLINNLKENALISRFIIVLFIANLVFLILFTAGIFLLEEKLKQSILPYLALSSLYFTTNTIGTILINSIQRYNDYKKQILKKLK